MIIPNTPKAEPIFIKHNREKLLNAMIFFLKKTKKCGKLKMLKLLYFLDFIHFKQTGKSVTDLRYFAWKKGPVAQELWHELAKPKDDLKAHIAILPTAPGEFLKMIPRKKFDSKYNDYCLCSKEYGIISLNIWLNGVRRCNKKHLA